MKKLVSLLISSLVITCNVYATKYTLFNGNFGTQTSSMSFVNGDIIEIPAGANVSFTTTQTINPDIILDVRGTLKMTPGNKILTLSSGSEANIYPNGELSGHNASQKLFIGSNNVFNGTDVVGNSTNKFTANGSSAGFASYTPLPIKLVSFDAALNTSSKVSLNWSAINDGKTNSFSIEQSVDGKNWVEVATVAATGDGHETVNYSYEVEAPKAVKTAIYRLRFEGAEGQAYSSARSVSIGGVAAEPTALITVAAGNIQVSVNGVATDGSTRVQVTSLDGKVIYNQAYSSTTAASVATYARGLYIVTVTDNNSFKISQKVMM